MLMDKYTKLKTVLFLENDVCVYVYACTCMCVRVRVCVSVCIVMCACAHVCLCAGRGSIASAGAPTRLEYTSQPDIKVNLLFTNR